MNNTTRMAWRRWLRFGALALALGLCMSARSIVRGTPARFMGTLEIKEQSSQPATPASGYGNIWFDTSGIPHSTTDGGVDQELGTTDTLWGSSGTDISPLTADDDVLLDDGSTLGWGDANPGTIETIISDISAGLISLGGLAAAPGVLRFLEDSDNGTDYVGLGAPASVTTAYDITPAAAPPSRTLPVFMSSAGALTYTTPVQTVIGTLITPSTVVGNAAGTAFTLTGGSNEGSDTLAENACRVGEHIRIRAGGYITSDNDGSETLTLLFKIGSKTIYTTGAIDLAQASYTTEPWVFDVSLTGLTAGGTGTVDALGTFTYMTTASAAATLPIHASITSFDTTATQQFTITATWANGDATPDVAGCTTFQWTANNYN